jgi:DNA repair exonuclease SbcCD ATPase subunit
MKPRLVLWGNDAQNERVLIALELRPDDNKVNLFTFPENVVTEEFHQKMMDEWRDGKPLDFPEGYTTSERELSITESLLPEALKVERGDVVQRAQTEWHFMVLSSKLNESYTAELSGLKDRVEKLESYDNSMWDELKQFWDKVQSQVRDRNLLKSHSDSLRDSINHLFDHLKRLRSRLDEEFDKVSRDNYDKFINAIQAVEKKISDGMRLAPIFDELKEMQRNFRDARLSREHRSKVWEKLDAAFKAVKEKRFGPETGGSDQSPLDRLNRRYEGLVSAIEKMQRSIQRDHEDLEFQNRKIERTDGQLEAQIRQAKIKMIEERIRSKEEKLNEMLSTRNELEQRTEQQRRRQADRDRVEEAKRAAQQKIAQDMKARDESVDSQKMAKAVEAIRGEQPEAEPTQSSGSILSELGEKLQDLLQDTVDTARAVAEVAGDKLEELVEDVQERVEDYLEAKEKEESKSTTVQNTGEPEAAEEIAAPPTEPVAPTTAEAPALPTESDDTPEQIQETDDERKN